MDNQVPNSSKPTDLTNENNVQPMNPFMGFLGNPLPTEDAILKEGSNPPISGNMLKDIPSFNSPSELPNNVPGKLMNIHELSNGFLANVSSNATRKEKALFQMFLTHFESSSRYIDHDFNLKVAAREIGTNEKYLSSAINNCSGMSFNKIVNHYRITNAKKLITDDVLTRLNLEEIAYMSGFGNRTTFYRVFTEILGITPSRYRDNLNRGIPM
jgi:AraC-like DNA-binding protein